MKKKFFAVLLASILVLTFFTPSLAEKEIAPLADVGTTLIMGLKINGSTVEAYAYCTPLAPRVATVSIRIEKYINGGWSVVCRNAGPDKTSTSCPYVEGVKYRAYATCTVYENGKQVDSASKYSAVKP